MKKRTRPLSYPETPPVDPGFKTALKWMRSRDGWMQENGFSFLRARAAEYAEALIQEFANETDLGVRYWLLELIGEARSRQAFDLLVSLLHDEDKSIRIRAARGLQLLDS